VSVEKLSDMQKEIEGAIIEVIKVLYEKALL
jgi:hypothetical protein